MEEISCNCPKILLVDDEPFNLMALEGLLMMNGIENVQKIYNGATALEQILANASNSTQCANHKPFTLVILDKNMPGLSGIEVATKVRALQ